ncbi:MAG: hypothetical protein JNL38_04590 [Myxococcales bacterium]|nr:hypothetical protein [Myxococcales bacterium]
MKRRLALGFAFATLALAAPAAADEPPAEPLPALPAPSAAPPEAPPEAPPAAPPAAPAVVSPETPKDLDKPPADPPPRERSMSALLSPLQLISKTASVDLVWVPVAHHAVVLNPRLRPVDGVRWGGELGYRYYTSSQREPSGFFAGPSFAFFYSEGGSKVGVAVDVGVQVVAKSGLTASGGLGLMWVPAGSKIELGSKLGNTGLYSEQWNFIPRMLAALGYAF